MSSWWWFCCLVDTFGSQRVMLALLSIVAEHAMAVHVWSLYRD